MITPAKHSPAPWQEQEDSEGHSVWDARGNRIAFCEWWTPEDLGGFWNDTERPVQNEPHPADENARLIAAAPELLTALRHLDAWDTAILEAVKKTWGENVTYRKIKEDLGNAKVAIAQATGGEP